MSVLFCFVYTFIHDDCSVTEDIKRLIICLMSYYWACAL